MLKLKKKKAQYFSSSKEWSFLLWKTTVAACVFFHFQIITIIFLPALSLLKVLLYTLHCFFQITNLCFYCYCIYTCLVYIMLHVCMLMTISFWKLVCFRLLSCPSDINIISLILRKKEKGWIYSNFGKIMKCFFLCVGSFLVSLTASYAGIRPKALFLKGNHAKTELNL